MSLRIPILIGLLFPLTVGCQDTKTAGNGPSTDAATELPTDVELRAMIDRALQFTYSKRHLNLDQNAAWQILHGALPFGMKFKVYNGDERVGAMQWVLDGNQMNGWTLRHGTKNLQGGRRGLKMVLESGTKTGQGHEDQWLAVIAQCGLPIDQKIIFKGQEYLLQDVVQQSMWDVYEGKECSWTLIALVRFLADMEAEWDAGDGKTWSLEKIIDMEARQDLSMSACGGTHRLIGMTMALDEHLEQSGKLEGGWRTAADKIEEALELTRQNQQPDGSFSTNYFSRPGTSPDLALRINTTGHTLEFLALALEEEELAEPWVVRAVVQLCDLFEKTKDVNLECGSLYHATHGLMEYYERRFGPWQYPDEESAVASRDADETSDTLSEN